MTPVAVQTFEVAYSRALTQYVVRRGEIEIVPTPNARDPIAWTKARGLALALNRVYGEEASAPLAYGADEHHFADGAPRPGAREWFEEERAAALARTLHKVTP